MTKAERLQKAYGYLVGEGIISSQTELANAIKGNKSSISQALKGKPSYLTNNLFKRICNIFPQIDYKWLVNGEGDMLSKVHQQPIPNMEDFKISEASAKRITSSEHSKQDKDFDSALKHYDTPDGIIKAPLIGQYANGGYLRGYSDPVYLEEQPSFFSTRAHSGGHYVAFEVKGDSMNNGTVNAICEGDILLGRELQRHHWGSKLHVPKVFIIVHRTEGITVKEIISHDVETGRIVCHSWNEDPEYENFALNLQDVVQLFYIKEISRNFKL